MPSVNNSARDGSKQGPFISDDDDDGSENVAKKMNLRSFKLNRVYLDPLDMPMQATFPGVEFVRILFKFKRRKENS